MTACRAAVADRLGGDRRQPEVTYEHRLGVAVAEDVDAIAVPSTLVVANGGGVGWLLRLGGHEQAGAAGQGVALVRRRTRVSWMAPFD